MLAGTISPLAPGALGFDTDTRITVPIATSMLAAGFRFCLRYLSIQVGQSPGDLNTAEANVILNAGLSLMAVQHVRLSGWRPNGALGTADGTNAANNSANVGIPNGVNIWLDLEGIDLATPTHDVIDHCNNWAAATVAAGYVPGIYVGANCGLTGLQLDTLNFSHYWKSLSRVPALSRLGYQMTQTGGLTGAYVIDIDEDSVVADNTGGVPTALKRP